MLIILNKERLITRLQKEYSFRYGAPSVFIQGHRSLAALGRASPLRRGFGERVSENGY